MKKQILSYLSLGQICDVQSGGTPSRHINAYWENGNIPWVKISDIKGKHLFGTDEFITRQGLENSSAKIFPKGTILYTIFATLGETTILNIDAATNQAIAGINIHDQYKEIILTDYLYYYLLSIKDIMCKIGRGVAQNNLNLKILRNVQVPVPSIEEQKKIIDTLSLIEKIMLVKDKQLSRLSNLVKSRFLERFGEPGVNDKEFPCYPVGQIAESVTYGTSAPASNSGQYEYLRMNNLTDNGQLDLSDLKRIDMSDEQAEKYMVKKGDILFNRTNSIDLVGKTALFNLNTPMIIAGYLIRIRLSDKVNPVYFTAYMNMPYMKEKLRNMAKGAVNRKR